MISVSWIDGCTIGSSSSFFTINVSLSFPYFSDRFYCMDSSTMPSFPLLKVIALHYSLPSLLGFTFEVVGNVPCCLLVNKVAIRSSYISRFLICAY